MLACLSISSLSNRIGATSPHTLEEKIDVRTFFVLEEIPPIGTIGNFTLRELQTLQMIHAEQRRETINPRFITYYEIRPEWATAY